MRLSDFDVISFDCYGTLVDWETGIIASLAPWLRRCGLQPSAEELLGRFARYEMAAEAGEPSLPYPLVLATVLRDLAREWGARCTDAEARDFGASVGDWPVFPDTTDALRRLQGHCKLVVLSNVDRASFHASNARIGVEFDAVFTAEEIGSYKPDPRNFRFLLAALAAQGRAPHRVLHTAQSVFHDLAPAKTLGLATNWIDRRNDARHWGATPPPNEVVAPDFRHLTLADFADAYAADREERVV